MTNHRLANSKPNTYPNWSHGNNEHKNKLRGMYSMKARSEGNTELKTAVNAFKGRRVMILTRATAGFVQS